MKRRTFLQSMAGWVLAAKFSCLWPGFADVQVAPLNDQVLALLEPDTVFLSSRAPSAAAMAKMSAILQSYALTADY